MDSPYAGPRDAARHRFQATLTELESSRDIKAAIRGFGEAFALDRTYAPAAFNLGVMAAIAEQWTDAIPAFEQVIRLEPAGLGKVVAPQLERLRLIASFQKAPEGRRTLRYDAALYPVLQKLGRVSAADSMAALVEVGHIDPRRWEAPALLAGLNGAGRGYDIASKYLEIAVANAADPAVMTALNKALAAAQREITYAATETSADLAWERGDYRKAAELHESAWTTIPARAEGGMDAAAAWLAEGETAHAAQLLQRLCQSGDSSLTSTATVMLAQLKSVEPQASASPADSNAFFRDRGSTDPVQIASFLPPIDKTDMETLVRPLPKLVEDTEPIVLLESLAADRTEGSSPVPLPVLPPARIAGDHPWNEIQALAARRAPAKAVERPLQTAELSGNVRTRRLLAVTTEPAGAKIFVDDEPDVCQSPCEIQLATGTHLVRVTLPGFEPRTAEVKVGGPKTDLALELTQSRGNVVIEAPAAAAVKVNGTAVVASTPFEMALVPGLYRVSAKAGTTESERLITVKPGARLRLRF
jgi:tetratricopeptide (TPR) repeat protein